MVTSLVRPALAGDLAAVLAVLAENQSHAPENDVSPEVGSPPSEKRYASRRRGVAKALVERVLADARAAGCFKVQLLSHKRHATDGAHDLYRSLGFSAEAEGFRLYL